MTRMTYPQLCEAMHRLQKSERGSRALKNIGRFLSEGGIGLDNGNKRAAMALITAAFDNPWDLPSELTNQKEMEP